MNRLLETKFYSLVNREQTLQESIEIHLAYLEFAEQIQSIVEREDNYISSIRILNYTRIELIALTRFSKDKQGIKCSKKTIDKSDNVNRF